MLLVDCTGDSNAPPPRVNPEQAAAAADFLANQEPEALAAGASLAANLARSSAGT